MILKKWKTSELDSFEWENSKRDSFEGKSSEIDSLDKKDELATFEWKSSDLRW